MSNRPCCRYVNVRETGRFDGEKRGRGLEIVSNEGRKNANGQDTAIYSIFTTVFVRSC